MQAKPISHQVESLRKSLDEVGKLLSSLSSVSIQDGNTRAVEAKDDAIRIIEEEAQHLRQRFAEISKEITARAETLDKTVHEKPYWFVAAAGGLGFLLGKLVRQN